MNILLGKENLPDVNDKHVVLELETLLYPDSDEPVTAYCLIEADNVEKVLGIDQHIELHENFIKNYKKGDMHFCKEAIGHLIGKFAGEVDTFYTTMLERVKHLEKETLPSDWNGVVEK